MLTMNKNDCYIEEIKEILQAHNKHTFLMLFIETFMYLAFGSITLSFNLHSIFVLIITILLVLRNLFFGLRKIRIHKYIFNLFNYESSITNIIDEVQHFIKDKNIHVGVLDLFNKFVIYNKYSNCQDYENIKFLDLDIRIDKETTNNFSLYDDLYKPVSTSLYDDINSFIHLHIDSLEILNELSIDYNLVCDIEMTDYTDTSVYEDKLEKDIQYIFTYIFYGYIDNTSVKDLYVKYKEFTISFIEGFYDEDGYYTKIKFRYN